MLNLKSINMVLNNKIPGLTDYDDWISFNKECPDVVLECKYQDVNGPWYKITYPEEEILGYKGHKRVVLIRERK